jgi:hypothetical protein
MHRLMAAVKQTARSLKLLLQLPLQPPQLRQPLLLLRLLVTSTTQVAGSVAAAAVALFTACLLLALR